MPQHRTKLTQAGYSIVEIAIVLVAISMLVTGAMWAFADYHRQEKRTETADYMGGMHEAVLTYATTNRTIGTFVVFQDLLSSTPSSPTANAPTSRPLFVPSGRPFLPCPDLDGDGLEDRYLGIGGSSGTPTVTVYYKVSSSGMPVIDMNLHPGRCIDYKGNVPWRTLHTKPYDPWGQIYTYWVDPSFSDPVFGFDQSTRASPVFKYMAIPLRTGDYTYPVIYRNLPSGSNFGQISSGRMVMPRSAVVLAPRIPGNTLFVAPGIELNNSQSAVVAGELFLPNYQTYREATEIRRLRTEDGPEILIYEYRGIQVASTVSINVSVPTMANGIAFAIISHGKNGRGGRTYRPSYDDLSVSYSCNLLPIASPALISVNRAEIGNARRTLNCDLRNALYTGSCTRTQLATCGDRRDSHATFYSGIENSPSTGSDSYEFDDVVSWVHPTRLGELLQRRHVLPLQPPPVAVPNVYTIPQGYDHIGELIP